MNDIEQALRMLDEQFPLVPHTGAGRLFSTVRRMKAEQEHGIPINRRTGFAISVEMGKPANELEASEWEAFYSALCDELKRDYPDLHKQLFPVASTGKGGTGHVPYIVKVDSTALSEKRNVKVEIDVPGIYNLQVCCGGGGWPTPYEVGIYLDADNRQCCIIDWPRPCTPIKFSCEYGDFVLYLDTATEGEVLLAKEVTAEFFRDD